MPINRQRRQPKTLRRAVLAGSPAFPAPKVEPVAEPVAEPVEQPKKRARKRAPKKEVADE